MTNATNTARRIDLYTANAKHWHAEAARFAPGHYAAERALRNAAEAESKVAALEPTPAADPSEVIRVRRLGGAYAILHGEIDFDYVARGATFYDAKREDWEELAEAMEIGFDLERCEGMFGGTDSQIRFAALATMRCLKASARKIRAALAL